MTHRLRWALAAVVVLAGVAAPAAEHVVTPRLHHLRAGAQPEWADFPRQAEGPTLRLTFRAGPNSAEWALRLRQQDVKQTWNVRLNGKDLGRLQLDENDTVVYLPVPAGTLATGDNTLAVEQVGKVPDDVRVGEITLIDRPVRAVLSEASVDVTVREGADPVPCRLTILDAHGALATVGATSGDHLAVRPGVIYTGTGRAKFGLPAGEYTVIAGRGFEYGIDRVRLTLKPGDVARPSLTIRREVPTPGYVACDPHVHTLTFSGHGDATLDERVLTLAGECVELPIATEHNRQDDYHAAAEKRGVRRYFTPVVGNEVTTGVGHFNVFPLPAGGRVPDYKLKEWKPLFADIRRTAGPGVVILNHPRDLHAGFRPFGPERHLALTGEDLAGWELGANAMEVVNSGAQQTDVMRLVRDWLGLLNRGLDIAPAGASDSHDLSRFIVGQGRTYVRCPDDRPGALDVPAAVDSVRRRRVLASCGLLADITVNGKAGPGDLASVAGEVEVGVRVLGPSWATADRVELYANGVKVREQRIADGGTAGVKWEGTWTLPRPNHDTFLVAVATGPGVSALHWPIARPYQPTSPVVERRVIGVTGAVWLDADGDGRRTSAFGYAQRLAAAAGPDVAKLVASLAEHDEAVAAQTAGLLQRRGVSPLDPPVRAAAKVAGPHVERAFAAFAEAWREHLLARGR